jgi:hypothetical protein
MPHASLFHTFHRRFPARVIVALRAVLAGGLVASLMVGLMVGLFASASLAASSVVSETVPEVVPEAVHPNVHVVQDFHRHFANGERKALAALVVPDVEWTIPGQHAQAGTRKGVKEILPLLWQLNRAGIGTETLFLGGNERLVVGLSRGRVKRGGVEQEFFWVRVYELRDGRIVKVQDFPSDQQAADVFFWQAFPPKPAEELIRD